MKSDYSIGPKQMQQMSDAQNALSSELIDRNSKLHQLQTALGLSRESELALHGRM